MPLTNAQKQKRWRDKRNALATLNNNGLLAFVESVAALKLWTETEAYEEEGEAAQADLDYLIESDSELERLITEARALKKSLD